MERGISESRAIQCNVRLYQMASGLLPKMLEGRQTGSLWAGEKHYSDIPLPIRQLSAMKGDLLTRSREFCEKGRFCKSNGNQRNSCYSINYTRNPSHFNNDDDVNGIVL